MLRPTKLLCIICVSYSAAISCGNNPSFEINEYNPSANTSLSSSAAQTPAPIRQPLYDSNAEWRDEHKVLSKGTIQNPSYEESADYLLTQIKKFTRLQETGYVTTSSKEEDALKKLIGIHERYPQYLRRKMDTLSSIEAFIIYNALPNTEQFIEKKKILTPALHDINDEQMKSYLQEHQITQNDAGDATEKYQDILSKVSQDVSSGSWFNMELNATGAQEDHADYLNPLYDDNVSEETFLNTIEKAQNVYKIHLMPGSDMLLPTIKTFLDEYQKLSEQDRHIYRMKCIGKQEIGPNGLLRSSELPQPEVMCAMARIVCYATHNKEYAEKMLGWLSHIFADQKGVGICPRFNTSIDQNKFIFYAQGNADDRLETREGFRDPLSTNFYNPQANYTFLDTQEILHRARELGFDENKVQERLNTTQELTPRQLS